MDARQELDEGWTDGGTGILPGVQPTRVVVEQGREPHERGVPEAFLLSFRSGVAARQDATTPGRSINRGMPNRRSGGVRGRREQSRPLRDGEAIPLSPGSLDAPESPDES